MCVPLLAVAREPASPELLRLLDALASALLAVPRPVFSSALANYVFFPLSSLLQPTTDGRDRGDRVLEGVMCSMEVLVRKWRECGMDERVLQELWIMTILTLGGPLDPTKVNKGKRKEMSEEAEMAIMRVLLALMRPIASGEELDVEEDDDDPLGESIDWTADDPYPSEPSTKSKLPPTMSSPAPPPIPILFHTLTTLLALATQATSLAALQLSAIETLYILLDTYLAPHSNASKAASGPSSLLATALPGTASALSRIILSVPSKSGAGTSDQARRQSTPAIEAAFRVLGMLLTFTMGDAVTRELREVVSKSTASLEELVETVEAADTPLSDETSVAPSKPSTTPGPTLPTAAWLVHTLAQINTLLSTLAPLASHPSAPVRTAFSAFLSDVLDQCSITLGAAKQVPLEGLLALSSDTWPSVADQSKATLARLFAGPSRASYESLTVTIIKDRLDGLPRALLKSDEARVCRSTRIVVAALEALSSSPTLSGASPLHNIERWSWNLLRALDFERVSRGGETRGGAAQAWITSSTGPTAIELDWPVLRMAHVKETETLKELDALWNALGKWASAGGLEGQIVDSFLSVALGVRGGEAVAPSALLVLDGVLRGMGGSAEKARKKVLRGVVKGILGLLEQIELEVDEPSVSAIPVVPTSTSTDLLDSPAENFSITFSHQRGAVSLTPSLDALAPVSSASPTESKASHRVLLICLALRLLSTCADLLGSAFQPHLLKTLYHILSFLSPVSHPLLVGHATLALSRIAYSTSYASVQNLLLANVDYVINSVSQRLSLARLDPKAPLVLVEMIRLIGQPIVEMVQDLVGECFEALDEYHGYEAVTVGLWAVLDALVGVMVQGQEEEPAVLAVKVDRNEQDWLAFVAWYGQRDIEAKQREEEEMEEISSHPRIPFASTLPPDEDVPEPPQKEEPVIPATRPQLITAQILSKSTYFLSHPSPFLRSKVLHLIASSVPLLVARSVADEPRSSRERDLLPIIHSAWPYILNRFADKEPYVVLEACGLIEALATHVPTYMAKRILDDVWPRFQLLLASREKEDLKNPGLVGKTKYTVSHRIYLSVLTTLAGVVDQVPLKENVLWELTTLLLRFLDAGLEREIREIAMQVYRALGRVNPDVVWVVLRGSLEEGEEEQLPMFLRREVSTREGLRGNVQLLLDELE